MKKLVLAFLLFTTTLYAQQEQKLKLKGLHAQVIIQRDQWGVNHIYAKNEHDLFFAQGYAAAKDRLFQFEIWRRQATGTVAEILGERELKRDIGTRLFKFRGNMQKELQHYHPRGASIINVYVEGVNAYIDQVNENPDQLPFEFKTLHIKPGRWTAEVVISRHQGLLGNAPQELNIGRAVARAGAQKVKDIMWFHPKEPNLQLDSTINGGLLDKDILGLYNAYRTDVEFTKSNITEYDEDDVSIYPFTPKIKKLEPYLADQEMEGSNNWIIGANKSASGFPMLANDPHRKIALPSLRYIVHLNAPGWNVIGGGEPTIPGVSIGHNDKGAWGLTIFETDGEDLYVYKLNPKNLQQYWYKGHWENMKMIEEKINIKNTAAKDVQLYYTLHGPVTFIDSTNHIAYAMKCAWMEPGGSPYLSSLRIDQATDWESFREACNYSNIPGENMIWADKKGNIGWQAVGIIPIRKNFSGYVPVPGDGRYEWSGFLPIKERPHLFNPAKGFFATANNDVTPMDYKRWDAIGYTWADDFRANRINSVLNEKKKLTLQDMAHLQTDYFSVPASEIIPLLKGVKMPNSTLTNLQQQLVRWNKILDKQSIEAAFYVSFEKEIMAEANKLFIPENIRSLVSMPLQKVIAQLKNLNSSLTTVEDRNAFLTKCFTQAFDKMQKKLGTDTKEWVYGQAKYKHISFEHPLSAIVNENVRAKINLGPLPRGGYGYTVGSTGSADNQASGASFRILMDTKNWDQTLIINTPGQSGDYKSPFYSNLFTTWANDAYFPSYFSKELVQQNTVEYTILEAKK